MPRVFDPPPEDLFRGPERLRRLSARLAAGVDEDVMDADIADALGPEVVGPFRHAQDRLRGRVRKTTREPAFCHSADIALRALDLGYDQRVRAVALLHDVVEDRSADLSDVRRMLDDIRERFGEEIARDTRVLTNRYQVLLESTTAWLPRRLAPDPSSLSSVRDAVLKVRELLPPAIADDFAPEIEKTLVRLLPEADLTEGARRARIDHNYTILSELRLHSYYLFVEELADDARVRAGSTALLEAPLVVKSLDLVDNLRTTEVVSWLSLERILVKAESFLDRTFYLHEHIHRHAAAHPSQAGTFLMVYEYVKHHLVEQLAERRRALEYLSDSRFMYLAEYLVAQVHRLQAKYRITEDAVGRLAALRGELRAANQVTD